MSSCDVNSCNWQPSYREASVDILHYAKFTDADDCDISVSFDRLTFPFEPNELASPAIFITAGNSVYLRLNWEKIYEICIFKLFLGNLKVWRSASKIKLISSSDSSEEVDIPVYLVQELPELMTQGVVVADEMAFFDSPDVVCFLDVEPEQKKFEDEIRELFHGGRLLSRCKDGTSLWLYREHLFLLKPFLRCDVWLAEEQSFLGEPPLWLSDFSHVVSPVYELRELRTQIFSQTGFSPHCILLLSGAAQVIDAEYVFEQWEKASVHVCCRSADKAGEYCPFVNNVVDECVSCTHSAVSLSQEDIQVLSYILN